MAISLPDRILRACSLTEKADVVVADIHGALRVYNGCLETLIDARRRFLAAGGAMIRRTEHIWIAVADLSQQAYADKVEVWVDNRWGVDLLAGRRFGTDWDFKTELTPSQRVTGPACVATFNYHELHSPSFSSQIELNPIRDANAKGYAVWFDTEFADGVSLSTAPRSSPTVYSNIFLPWSQPVTVQTEGRIAATICFNAVNKSDVWRWETRIEAAGSGEVKAEFRQSNFNTMFVSAEQLRKHASSYRTRLNKTGAVGRVLLELMDGSLPQSALAQIIMQRFPTAFGDEKEALQVVVDFTERYSE